MKKLMTIFGAIIFTSLILTSCGSTDPCDKFIKDYEEFVYSYIDIIKKMKANPSDMTIMSEYTEMLTKAAKMQTESADCTDPKYADKLLKLSTKIAKAAAAM
ncbi:MAG: hypothetical protein COC01_07810 [Bacteroidetes bacterium]|nr:MAG: hypothetical protein COC01_07810 [Bacteroidota bacterium]